MSNNKLYMREWRNWQTRTFEGRVVTPYGFKSRFSHQKSRIILIRLFLSKPQVWHIISPSGLDIINNGKPLLYIITLSRVSFLRFDDIQHCVLVICNFLRN